MEDGEWKMDEGIRPKSDGGKSEDNDVKEIVS